MEQLDTTPRDHHQEPPNFKLGDILVIYVLSQAIPVIATAIAVAAGWVSSVDAGLVVAALLLSPVVLTVLVVAFATRRRILGFLISRLRWQSWRRALTWGIGIGVVARIIGGLVIYVEDRYQLAPVVQNNPFVDQLSDMESPTTIALAAFAIIVLGPFAEELFYRAAVIRALRHYVSHQPALVISSLIFGAVHLNWGLFIPLSIAGYLLGFVYLRLHSLIPAVIAHAVFNAVAVFAAIYGGQ